MYYLFVKHMGYSLREPTILYRFVSDTFKGLTLKTNDAKHHITFREIYDRTAYAQTEYSSVWNDKNVLIFWMTFTLRGRVSRGRMDVDSNINDDGTMIA